MSGEQIAGYQQCGLMPEGPVGKPQQQSQDQPIAQPEKLITAESANTPSRSSMLGEENQPAPLSAAPSR